MAGKERVKVPLRLSQEQLSKLDAYVKMAQTDSRNQFLIDAIEFYGGYISSEKNKFLPTAIASAMIGIIDNSEDRISRIIFKNTVELSMVMNILAAVAEIDEDKLRALRAKCIKDVKGTIGQINFDEIYKYQKRK
ncbi:hypothetical protein WKT02_11000 [Erysipelotrichaceae bacterium HCN-30851]